MKLDNEQLLRDLGHAQDLNERGQHQEAHDLLLRVRAATAKTGVRSGYVAWTLAIATDLLGRFEESMTYINEALVLDPLAAAFNRSFTIISKRIRGALLDEGRKVDDSGTPGLYRLLVDAGGADVEVHLVMARYLLTTGDKAASLNLIGAVIALNPSSAEAWLLKAEIAVGMGDHQTAATATAEAAALGHEPMRFAMSGVAWA